MGGDAGRTSFSMTVPPLPPPSTAYMVKDFEICFFLSLMKPTIFSTKMPARAGVRACARGGL
jgi:hypothetical protein